MSKNFFSEDLSLDLLARLKIQYLIKHVPTESQVYTIHTEEINNVLRMGFQVNLSATTY